MITEHCVGPCTTHVQAPLGEWLSSPLSSRGGWGVVGRQQEVVRGRADSHWPVLLGVGPRALTPGTCGGCRTSRQEGAPRDPSWPVGGVPGLLSRPPLCLQPAARTSGKLGTSGNVWFDRVSLYIAEMSVSGFLTHQVRNVIWVLLPTL